jgi:hypothetical protein
VTTTRTMIRQFVALLTIEPMMILQGSKGFSKCFFCITLYSQS